MHEWPVLVKFSVGISIFLMLLSVVILIIHISVTFGNNQIEVFASKILIEDYSEYQNKIMDKPTIKNVLRANKDRLPVYIGSSINPLSEDPAVAHIEIKNFLKDSTKKYQIYIENTNYGTIMKVIKK